MRKIHLKLMVGKQYDGLCQSRHHCQCGFLTKIPASISECGLFNNGSSNRMIHEGSRSPKLNLVRTIEAPP